MKGWGSAENQDVKNGITDKRLKENFGNLAISLLVQKNLISASKDLRHLMVEFGYLFLDNRSGPQAMFKLTTPKGFCTRSEPSILARKTGTCFY